MTRQLWKLAVFVLWLVLGLQALGTVPSRFLPAASPFLAINAAIATRSVHVAAIFALPLAIVAFLRGRWFCRHACPVGMTCRVVIRSVATGRQRGFPRVNGVLVFATLAGAVLGYPLFLFLDPLSIFQEFLTVRHFPHAATDLLPAAPFAALVLISAVWSGSWCAKVCPLGHTQDLLRAARSVVQPQPAVKAQTTGNAILFGRRALLACGIGLLGAGVMRAAGRMPTVIRPPGALPGDRFSALCVRCGKCIRACPTGILRPDLGESGVLGFLTPLVVFDPGYCAEDCAACAGVCPTGAISPFGVCEKHHVTMGLAVIDPATCIAHIGESCILCRSACPYKAIRMDVTSGFSVPVVDPRCCTGCGACIVACPGRGKTIVIRTPVLAVT